MADLGTLSVNVSADTKGLNRGVNQADKSLKDLGRTGRTESKKINSQVSGMVSNFAKLAPAIGAAMAAFSAGKIMKDALREQEQLQRNMMRTEQIVKSTGEAAGHTAEQLHQQARALALGTLESTEGVMEAQQILLSFRKVSGDTFTRATELASDLAAVTGGSLKGAVSQLGKALEDPVQGLNAMARSGVSFSEQQKETIKSLVETNQHAAAQKIILDELAQQYGGVSRAQAMGLAGAQDTLGQSIQETKIAMAEYLNLEGGATSFYNALTKISDGIRRIFTSTEELREQSKQLGISLFGVSDEQGFVRMENHLRTAKVELKDAQTALSNFDAAIAATGQAFDKTNPNYVVFIDRVREAEQEVNKLSQALGEQKEAFAMDDELALIEAQFAGIAEANAAYADQIRRDKVAQEEGWLNDLKGFHDEYRAELDATKHYRDTVLTSQLETLRQAGWDEITVIEEKHLAELEQLEEFLDQKIVTQQEYDQLLLESTERREQSITDAEKQAALTRINLADMEARAKMSAYKNLFGNLSSLMNTENKKLFEIGKVAAMSGAAVSGYEAAVEAYKGGLKVSGGNPLVGAAFATASTLATGAQIAGIKRQTFGGGGGGATSFSGGTPAVNTQQAGGGAAPAQSRTLLVQGDFGADRLFTGDAVRGIMASIAEQQQDGYQVVI